MRILSVLFFVCFPMQMKVRGLRADPLRGRLSNLQMVLGVQYVNLLSPKGLSNSLFMIVYFLPYLTFLWRIIVSHGSVGGLG